MNSVAIVLKQETDYSKMLPYNPSKKYPEFCSYLGLDSTGDNRLYETVRESFLLLKYDNENYNTINWNPLSWLIKQGETVFIKPNMISEKHKLNTDWDYVITHGSVIRVILDYVFLAMRGKGRVVIGDAPQTDSNYSKIIELIGLREIREVYNSYPDFEIHLINLQDEYWIEKDGVYIQTVKLPGDPLGGVVVDLANDSVFAEFNGQGKKYYGAFYNINETNVHQSDGKHEYAISKSAISADVFINIPKLKTHKKCGLTVNLKSLVGINANKNWLPHYIFGAPEIGGDQFAKTNTKSALENIIVTKAKKILLNRNPLLQFFARRLKKFAYKLFGDTEKVVRSGNWHGNDTVWRMCLDLNRILMYANPDGSLRKAGEEKKFFSVVDGILSMEGNGPVAGNKKQTGVIIMGDNSVAVDSVCAKLMGFDWLKIKLIQRAFEKHKYPLINENTPNIICMSNKPEWNKNLVDINYSDVFHFRPHFGWVGHIELDD